MTTTIRSYAKRSGDIAVVRFDFREYAASVGVPLTYRMRADAGITVSTTLPASNQIDLAISGGALGRTYLFGMEARTADLRSLLDLRRMRIREPANSDTAALDVVVDGVLLTVLTDDIGVELTDDAGDLLVG